MWSYCGAKTNVVNWYPKPKHDKIIEPFAGSARYALKYFDREVLLVDKYDVITSIWLWLQTCSPDDILKLPRLKAGETLDSYTFDCPEAKMLMGFLVGYGLERPRVTATNKQTVRPNFINYSLKRIASQLFKIKHWEIINASYEAIPDQDATWFIDPPYQHGGQCYPMSSKHIDFEVLASWSASRSGQVIVCESMKADWMQFKPLISHKGRTGMQSEGIWSNETINHAHIQKKLFA
jgi:site-specific DNA-adenine methylase